METTTKITIRVFWCIVLVAIFSEYAQSQVAPYALSPKWMFGKQAGIDFTSGSPVVLSGNPANDPGQEASTTMCDPTKNIVIYSNNSRVFNGSNVQYMTVNGTNGQSSTNGAIIVPDPSSPTNQFFLFTGNDITGGSSSGINFYQIKNTAGVLSTLAGPTNLATGAQVSEALCAGTDGSGGYWIVAHTRTTQYWAWHVTAAGVTLAHTTSTVATTGGGGTGSLKISQCQNRIASISQGGSLAVYNWDNVNGVVTGAALRSYPTGTYNFGYGCEFSMDGSMLYFTTLGGNQIYQLEISTGTVYADATANGKSSNNITEMGTLQLGPDNKIYVTNVDNFGGTVYIGVVALPNVQGVGCNYNNKGFILNSGPGFYPEIYRGIANIAFTYPNTPVITATVSGCSVDFSYVFKTYFKDNITIQPGSESWDFGDATTGTGATPTHVYPSGTNSYNVTLTFKDNSCGQTWTATTTVNTSCAVAPVKLISFTGLKNDFGTVLSWSTATEKNNNYFEILKSDDGINFYSIGKVKGGNNSSDISNYEFIDPANNGTISYYKLVQYDFDGANSSSDIITIRNKNSVPFISPNPSNSSFNISFSDNGGAVISILDLTGRIIEKKKVEENIFSVNMGEELSSGTYIISVINGSESFYYKVIKE
jgi:hypothetical protein